MLNVGVARFRRETYSRPCLNSLDNSTTFTGGQYKNGTGEEEDIEAGEEEGNRGIKEEIGQE